MVLSRSNRYYRYPRTCFVLFFRRFRLFLLWCFFFVVLWFVVRLLVNCGCSTLVGGCCCSCGGGCCGDRRRMVLDKTKVCNNKVGSGTSRGERISINRTGKFRRRSRTVLITIFTIVVTLLVVVFSFWECAGDGPPSGVFFNFCKAKNPSYCSIRPCKVSKIVVVTLSDPANAMVPIGNTNGVDEGFMKGSVCFQTKTSP